MVMDEARTSADSVGDHVDDHNLLHARYNEGTPSWGSWIAVDGGVGFQNAWLNHATYQAVEYRKHPDGMVQIRGVVRDGTSTVFTLPAGYRPPGTDLWTVPANEQSWTGTMKITPAGDVIGVYMQNGANAAVSLDYQFDSTGGS